MVGGYNHPIGTTTICDAHCACRRHRSGLYLLRLLLRKLIAIYQDPKNLPSPFNCSASSSLSPMFSLRFVQLLTIYAIILMDT